MSNTRWPYTNAHFLMIDQTIETLKDEGEEVSQQDLGEKVGEQEEAVSGGTATKYLSDRDKRTYWRDNEPVVRLEKPEEGGGHATVYWIHEDDFDEEKHGKYKSWGQNIE